jgi:hypothetical protein
MDGSIQLIGHIDQLQRRCLRIEKRVKELERSEDNLRLIVLALCEKLGLPPKGKIETA